MKKEFIIGLLATVTLIGAGCSKTATTTSQNTPPAVQEKVTVVSNATEPGHGGEHLAKLAGSRIDLENKNSLQSGEVSLRFKLYGLDGHEFGEADLKIAHEKRMHFLMVRDDMTGFQHLHPEYQNGKWEVKTMVPEKGVYQLYIDIAPIEETPIVLRVPVTIGGVTEIAKAPTPNPELLAEDGEYKVTLGIGGPLKTNMHTKLTFALTKNGQPVAAIDPYLGAYGHVVLLRHTDPDDFFHVHPLTETKPTDGTIQFEAQFPVKGRYTLYAQFNVGNSVKTFPITVDVTEVGEDTDTTHGHGTETNVEMMNDGGHMSEN